MFVRNNQWIISIALCTALATWVSLEAKLSRQHLRGEACGDCHLASEVNASNAGTLRASDENLCTRCHEGAVTLSHPSGVAPGRSLPASFPLDWKGTSLAVPVTVRMVTVQTWVV